MNFRIVIAGLLTTLLVSGAGHTQTLSDTEKEQRWAEQIIDTLFDGEPVWLDANGHEFLGIEMEPVDDSKDRAAIVVHGIGIHPNWEQVIRPLRVDLTEHGWHTLSIQMPILPNEAEGHEYFPLFAEVPDRFDAAVSWLQDQGISEIVIIAHSMGSAMTSQYLALTPDSPVKGVVLIGMNLNNSNEDVNLSANLGAIGIPILDLYGSDDLPGVIESAPLRKSTAESGETNSYTQVMVENANHFFDGQEEVLVEQVSSWIDNVSGL